MEGGDGGDSPVQLLAEQISTLSVDSDEGSSGGELKQEKDPRKIARKYQIDLCKKALGENIIVYLETGCGKTHIAVLLMFEMRDLIKKPQKNICVFLAPTVALVEQQAKVIEDSTNFKVGMYCGSSKRLKRHHEWEKEMEKYEVFVMTPQILLGKLCHCFISIELIALLIFDECHYAQLDSDHPYAEIMKVFYKSTVAKLPRVFGMTASPKFGKGASISSLETLLHAKVYSVTDKEELEQYVHYPQVNIYHYDPVVKSSDCPHMTLYRDLEEIKHLCVSTLSTKTIDHSSCKSSKKMLRRLHENIRFCLESLGLWGAFQACRIQRGDSSERNGLMEAALNGCDDALRKTYLSEAASVFACHGLKDGIEADLSSVKVFKEPLFSRKLSRLIEVLSEFKLQPNMKCIIFVNRIVIARSLSHILQTLDKLSSWKCGFLLGVHSGLKSMSRKNMNIILEKFRSGELNLLVATKVGEEGLDIQTCCLVIRFDLPDTVASFIQSRGRARMPVSEYAFLVDRGNEREMNLIQSFQKDEDKMNLEIASRTSGAPSVDFEETTYKIASTGATISSGYSVSLLHHYCSKLPHDEYFNPKPEFYIVDDVKGTICSIILPCNAPIHEVVGSPQPSTESAKKDACLKACKELHELGSLTDFLLPDQDDGNEDLDDNSDSDSFDGEACRGELHEMLVPAAFKEPWTDLENFVCLNSYFVKFSPTPADRLYRKFGLFVKASLPEEAVNMALDLCLAHGRSVKMELVKSGVTKFEKDEIVQAQCFQEISLKAILDRSQLIPQFVSLALNDFSDSSSATFYLLLPVIWHEHGNTMAVDWKLVKRCLSSPIFRSRGEAKVNVIPCSNYHLELANGPHSINDVENSLVYAPCKDTFFFISKVVPEKNAYDSFKDSTNHVEHYFKTFGIQLLYPDQPLVEAKQLFCLENLLRKGGNPESREKEEHFIELPPEICQLKIIGFSKDIGSSLSLLPSFMHRLESFLVAIELKDRFCSSFPEAADVNPNRVLEALTTENCNERFSLERLEVLGDAFLKFAVGRHLFLLHDKLDEGQLTRRRSNLVNNSNLCKLAKKSKLQVYIRDQSFDPRQFFALGRPCSVLCSQETASIVHSHENSSKNGSNIEVRCNKCHHWLHKKTIADVVEALVGAFIVDCGFKAAAAFLKWLGIQVDFEASQVSDICSASTIFRSLLGQVDIASLENLLGYQFLHKGLLVQAFVHPSYNHHPWGGCYQRLEFLGDAVLDYLITSYLYSMYPKLKPGQLTDLRSLSVCNSSFANIAVHRSFHKFILSDSSGLSASMSKYVDFITSTASANGLAQGPSCPKALGDLVESCVGAIFLDTGFDLNCVWKIMLSFMDRVMSFSKFQLSPVRELLELCQFYKWEQEFPSSKKDGMFVVEAKVKGENVSAYASATNINRKAAERMAAQHLYVKLKDQGYKLKSKSLEDVLKSSRKMEAKLIGYDEAPIDVTAPDAIPWDKLKVQEPSRTRSNHKVYPIGDEAKKIIFPPGIRSIKEPHLPSLEAQGPLSTANRGINLLGGSSKKSARSHLYEICAVNCWKPPYFECCKETGPCHLKEFTFKVSVDIEEASNEIVAFGKPHSKKKDTAENAAEGAIWYLKNAGYLHE